MTPRHRLRRASIVAGAGAALLLAVQPAAAAPIDTVLPIPVGGIGVGVTGLPSSGYSYLTATTDPDTPGVTRFGPYTGVHVHWRNLSSGAAGVAYVNNRYGTPVETGSGTVAAVVTISDAFGYRILASTPGAGVWTVP
ncbi:conserved exported hypothetical protein [Rhodococcus sp. RD6.2]|jgi:hypothetical protein|uniref:hypothetical protein n=1 Tax=Rhodococcus sp. RD6.2 TaxID=260936 RepID=UPI00063B2B38|nr:hypothetical protein [Rhodococcus sp. RD6.2]CRK51267.1 conserved exported hypothetical protein [Rhodococcus sp. RD6.2]